MGAAARILRPEPPRIVEPTDAEILDFNRRHPRGGRGNRVAKPGGGGTPSASAPWTPASITSVAKFFWFRSDLGITIGTGVSAWADQYGLNNATQATGGSQPTYTASDGTLGGLPSLTGDGVDDSLALATWDPPAPLTTTVWFWAIVKPITYTTNDCLWGGGSTTLILQQFNTDPSYRQYNASPVNSTTMTTGSWARVRQLFTGSTSDYSRTGSSSATGASAGNGNCPVGTWTLFALAGASAGNFAIAEVIGLAGEPTELALLEAYGAARYPGAAF